VIAVIFNPSAGGNRALRFQRQLATLSGQARLLPTTGPGTAPELAAAAARDGAVTVVAAGGDGTVKEVVNGLAHLPLGQRPALGVIPLGTVNVFAKEIGLPASIDRCWELIRARHLRRIDLARASHAGGSRWFIQMAGAGLDALAISHIRLSLKRRIGPLAYLWAGFQAIRQPLPLIHAVGGPESIAGQLVLVGNGRFYGGRFPVFANAQLNDGLLDLAVLIQANLLSLARATLAAARGRLLHHPGVRHQQATRFSLSGPHLSPFQVEGDNIGFLPASFEVVPGALNVVCKP
jgi:YegS/Rv2252/BmrU family lipid kinase